MPVSLRRMPAKTGSEDLAQLNIIKRAEFEQLDS